jgi:hypothetical protein
MATEYEPTAGQAGGLDAGEVENRLSLNPNDERWADELLGWEDGAEYVLANVRVIQISPGEFEVLDASVDPSSPAPNDRSITEPAPKTPLAEFSRDDRGRPDAMTQGRLGLNR